MFNALVWTLKIGNYHPMSTIYITGHRSPDLDSVAAAIAYAYLKTQIDPANEYVAAAAGELNKETAYLLEKNPAVQKPEIVENVDGKEVILIDHNEPGQSPESVDKAKILEVIDHHKLDFSYHEPIRILIEPIGSSSSIVFKLFRQHNVAVPKELAAVMLGAILVDTVITKSPTCTKEDRDIIVELAEIAGIENWEEYGMEIFKVRSDLGDLSDEAIVTADYKDFDMGGAKFGIGQVETADMSVFMNRKAGLLDALRKKKEEGGYHSVILFISDIINEESLFLVASDEAEKVAQAFGQSIAEDTFTAKVMSRKKEVVPGLMKEFE